MAAQPESAGSGRPISATSVTGLQCQQLGKDEPRSMSIASTLDMSSVSHAEKKCAQCGPGVRGIGYSCRKGVKQGARHPNQDSWAVHRLPTELSVYGVFDGHGECGHWISDFAKASITQRVLKDPRSRTDQLPKLLEEAFATTHAMCQRKPCFRADASGTTATVVVHDHAQERLSIAHVGDSTAVLLKQVPGSPTLEAEALTRDHKPQLPDERRRIECNGGRVYHDGYQHRVGKKTGVQPGLAMSRSLGDTIAHRCGVSAVPEVSQRELHPEDYALLLCSDGIWEVMTPAEAAEVVSRFDRWQGTLAARALAQEAQDRWVRGTGGKVVDDITVVLVHLKPGLERTDTTSTTASNPVTTCRTMDSDTC